MEDKDEFTFDEEESSFDSAQESDAFGDYEPVKKGGSKRLVYLLLLLLVLAGGAVYVLFLAPEDGPSPPVRVVTAPAPKRIATPMPKPVSAQPDSAAVPIAKPASDSVEQPVSAPADTDGTSAVTSVPVKPAPVAATVAMPEADTKPVETTKPALEQAQVTPKLFEPQPVSTPVSVGFYSLSAGAFVMQLSVDGVVKKIRKLGYDAKIVNIKRKIPMTRLLVGVYPPNVAAQKLIQIKKVTPDAFIVNKGGQTAVYAGSYLGIDNARVFADTTLSQNGIRVTEEPVEINRTLQRVLFGSFATQAEAEKISREAAGQGVDAKPVKN